MSFLLYNFPSLFTKVHRPKQIIIEEILKDSIKIEHDLKDIQTLCDKVKSAKTQEDIMTYIIQIEKNLIDVIAESRQIYNDIKEIVN